MNVFRPLLSLSLISFHFGYLYRPLVPLKVHCYSEALPTHHVNTVSEFHAKPPQVSASEELAKGPYVAAREGF